MHEKSPKCIWLNSNELPIIIYDEGEGRGERCNVGGEEEGGGVEEEEGRDGQEAERGGKKMVKDV